MNQVNLILADDHEIFRKGLEVTLRRIPFIDKIQHASNGAEVVNLLKKSSPDIIIMDIRMPVMDGIEATIEIRKQNQKVRILTLSMMDDKASIVTMFRAGANGYLLKNTNKQEIQEAIQTVMEGNSYYSKEVSGLLLNKFLNDKQIVKRKAFDQELTFRELEILKLICHQYSTREISDILNITEKTVEGHRTKLLEKTSSRNIAGLVMYALENDIIRKVI